MDFTQAHIDELKGICADVQKCEEGGATFFLMPRLKLLNNCTPNEVDALLCPSPRDGYESRLYFSEKPQCAKALNWNGSIRLLERNWFAFSWKTVAGLRLAQMLAEHLRGLR